MSSNLTLSDVASRREEVIVATPFGKLRIGAVGDHIIASQFVARPRPVSRSESRLLSEASRQIRGYFAKRTRRFDLPLYLEGTPLQIRIWQTVAGLEVGDIVSYADIARAVGAPGAHRAVAAAMGSAPFDLLIPAHRVIGADGRLKGAATNSMRRKLLAFEGHRALSRR